MSMRKRRSGAKAAAIDLDHEHQQKPFTQRATVGSTMNWIRRQPVWIVLAIASGACAAINGVFAKLTTTALTSSFASTISSMLGLNENNNYVNLALRGTFFGLNIVFNIAMWALFTAALTRSSSTTRVSIVNVSSNFFITAVLGALIFGEKLPLGWWLGAGLLAAGNVVIGRREEAEKPGGTIGLDETQREAQEAENLLSEQDDDLLELRESIEENRTNGPVSKSSKLTSDEDADNPI
ncbi:hypothetical protein H2198_009888 [Neophaeococcomyces mojaviensis]|uniref:Uncharacterized protein n=1 Tax=Neophaeococcomyces mojaviensis TaxID=3383035 RepID=A0ACC2ZTG8_9EURO|nr:hypothetical protein H2198_009888 [Knufia sp. JES_112]